MFDGKKVCPSQHVGARTYLVALRALTALATKKNNSPGIPPLIQIKNNSSGILRSRGHNFLFKAVGNFKIHRKFVEIGRFECGNFPENPKSADFVDFPLHSLYKRKGKSSKSADFGFSGKTPNSNRPISANF